MPFTRKYNQYRIENNTAILTLTKGQETIIDLEDLDRTLATSSWHAVFSTTVNSYYVAGQANGLSLKLHRFLLGVSDPKNKVDHKNNNTLDNRKENLRIVTPKQNAENRSGAQKNSLTGIRGVALMNNGSNNWYHHARVEYRDDCGTKKSIHKYFPLSDKSLVDAEAWVIAKRLEVFTHSDGR